MKKYFKATEKLSVVTGWISAVLIVIALIYMILYVVSRVVFKQAVRGSNEIIEIIMCMICFTAFAFTQVRRKHIQVGLVVTHLPLQMRYVLSAINCCWCTLLTAVLTYACWTQGSYAAKANKLSFVLKVPYAPFYYVCAILMALFVIVFLNDMIKSVLALCGNKEMQEDIAKGWI